MRNPRSPYVYLRWGLYLLWEFRWSLLVFWSLVLGGGLLLWLCYHRKSLGYLEACYDVFLMTFL